MLRLCSEGSRSFTPQGGTVKSPGDLLGMRSIDSAAHGNMYSDRAGSSFARRLSNGSPQGGAIRHQLSRSHSSQMPGVMPRTR